MDLVLGSALNYIQKGIKSGNKRYLINGKSCSGKTRLARTLLSKFMGSNILNPFIINGSNVPLFFSLDSYNDYKIIKIPIENSKITINYKDENKTIIHPFPQSQAYKNIFKEHKYIEKNKHFSYEKNLMIIDDCENINLFLFFILDRSLRLVFDNNEFFGGIHIILIGNSKVRTNFDNIFSSSLYNNNKNIYKLFNVICINEVKTKFTKTNFALEYYNLYSFFLKDKIQDRAGILMEEDKMFFKLRDVDVNRKDLQDNTYFSDDYDEISYVNEINIRKFNVIKYKVVPTKLFLDEEVEASKVAYFDLLYKKIFDPMFLFLNLKVFFTSAIPDSNITKGQIGYIKKIIFKKNPKNPNKILSLDKYIKSVLVETNNEIKEVFLKKITNQETGLSFKCLPINTGYCLHFKYLTHVLKGNLILTKDTNIHVVESCINKITEIGFKNTDLLNCPDLFESTYIDCVKNDTKLQT